jgi:DNA-binding Lrp family transcriptional regulator
MPILAFVLFKVSSGTETEVAKKIAELDEVMDAEVVFGEYDVVARVTTEDLDKLEDFVSQRIRTIPNVLVTSTMIISREFNGKHFRPKNK